MHITAYPSRSVLRASLIPPAPLGKGKTKVNAAQIFFSDYKKYLRSNLLYDNYGRFLVSGLNERHRTGSDRTEQRTGTNGTAFPLDRSMTVSWTV